MRYYLDCEFNGMGGELLSLALVAEDKIGPDIYLANSAIQSDLDQWVAKNVMPKIECEMYSPLWCPLTHWSAHLETFLRRDTDVTIITDWPDDIKYFCELILTGPGTMIEVRPSIKFEMHRVDAYPTTLPGAVQHNAYWDAMALRHKLQEGA